MARTVGANKAETHERIVRAAAKAIRREGYAGTSVADVMKDAGLTHGGFYAHFPSREAMLAEALDQAGSESVESLFGSAAVRAAAENVSPLEAMVASYLSDRHVAATDTGCTIAGLGSETRRQSPAIKKVATRRLKEFAKLIERQTAGADHPPEALAALSAMVGALVIARIVDDPDLGKQVRAAATRMVVGTAKQR
jgi:AcrR family transcriptional regulator